MADLAKGPPGKSGLLVAWVLGTFHAATLIIILLVVLYLTGALPSILTSLSTASGLALFIALWLTSTWSAHRTLQGLVDQTLNVALPTREVIVRATGKGGINGLAFLLCAYLILGVPAAFNGAILPVLYGGLFIATFGVLVALLVGCLVGLIFAGIDAVLLSAARAMLN
jgi:hypothetical protein